MTDRSTRRDIHPVAFAGALVRSAGRLPPTALGPSVRIVLNQVRFTAVHGLPWIVFLAAAFGVPLVLSVAPLTAELGVSGTVDRVLVTLVVQELGPVVAALLVVVRSGTAVVTELATARVTGEREALEVLGVDALQYYVLPRVVAFALSVALLTIFFDAVVMGALALARYREGSAVAFGSMVASAVSGVDVWITVAKGMVMGAGVAGFAAMEGLEAGESAATLPVAVSRGTMQAFLWVFVASALFAAVRFLA